MIINSNYTVTAMGTYIPERKLSNADLEKMVETNDEWIVKRTGIKERFISAEDEFASHLAIKAVQNMADTHSVDLSDIDMIIVSCFVADHLTPSVSALVAGHFGINAGTYDIHAACSGFAYACITANAFLASNQAKKVLIISSETLSKAVDYTDRGTCVLFGDAAVATLMERGTKEKLFISNYGTDGQLADKVYCSQYAPSVNAVSVEKNRLLVQNGQALYSYVTKKVAININNLLNEAQLSASDIDWFVPHSANLRMLDVLREKLGFEKEKMLTSVEDYGNTSSSSIPLAIKTALDDGRIKPGHKLLIYGFGGGITYAGAILEW